MLKELGSSRWALHTNFLPESYQLTLEVLSLSFGKLIKIKEYHNFKVKLLFWIDAIETGVPEQKCLWKYIELIHN